MSRPTISLAVFIVCTLGLVGCQSSPPAGGPRVFPEECQIAVVHEVSGSFVTVDHPVKYVGLIVKDEVTGDIRKLEVLMGPYPVEDPVDDLSYEIVQTAGAGGGLGSITITVQTGYVYVVESLSTLTATHCRPHVKTPRVTAVGEGTRYALCNLIQAGDPTRVYMWDPRVKLDSLAPAASSTTAPPDWYHDVLASDDNYKTLYIGTDGRVDGPREPIDDTKSYRQFESQLTTQAGACVITVPRPPG